MLIRIVGAGIAGSVLAMQAILNGYKVELWRSREAYSSEVASGIFNPVVLKRLRLVWKAEAFMDEVNRFYPRAAELIGYTPPNAQNLWHRFSETGRVNDWQALTVKEGHSRFLGTVEEREDLFFGKVNEAGWLDTSLWMDKVLDFVSKHYLLKEEEWKPELMTDEIPTILCQGWHKDHLPFGIPHDAFAPVKGEVLIVRLPGYTFDQHILHGGVFILPLADGCYKVGATYSWDDLGDSVSSKGREWLLERLRLLWDGPVEVLEQKAAVRPAVRDRKPILGRVPGHPSLFVLNGLGSRGTLMAPLLSVWMLDHIAGEKELPSEVNIQRFF